MTALGHLIANDKIQPVTSLSFHDFNEINKLPEEITELVNLEDIDLANIDVDEVAIKKLLSLPKLHTIYIQNFLPETFPLELMKLEYLKTLTINGEVLKILPAELDNWHTLTYLNVGLCRSLTEIIGLPPNLTYFYFNGSTIKTIPNKIYELKYINKLVAQEAKLTSIPKEIFKLSSLIALFLPNNYISSIPKEIKQLKKLQQLNMQKNRFRRFPINLKFASKLEIINFAENFITTIPNEAVTSLNLIEVNLYNNNLIEFPKVLLTSKIEEIDVRNFSFYDDRSHNKIKEVPTEILSCKKLTLFEIEGNPIENVPSEILANGLDAIKNFFQSKLEADKEEFLFEAKMVVVGRGNVGKTALTRKLVNPSYYLNDSVTTCGIDVLKNPFFSEITLSNIKSHFKLNIWDFGGQEKYDATHQLFITKRSIYLFLTEAREESNYLDFYYWLNTIQLFSDNSPVIIILSKLDERKKSLPESLYKEKFDNILEFVDVSCATGYEYTIDNLKKAIEDAIQTLPQIRLKLSNKWIDIRNELEDLANQRDFISYDEYLSICNSHSLDKVRADFLGQYLNDLGVIVHHQGDLLLRETVFINTDWCVDGMYKILDSEAVINGKFTVNDLASLWAEERFASKKAELLKLMHQYHLCFELKDGSGFIAPELLPPDKPADLVWDGEENLKFQYQYHFMPAGILSRFIIKSHAFIKDNIYWKHGVVLNYEGTLALVEEDYIQSKIKISLKGKDKKGLLAAIRMFITEVHKDFDKSSKLIFEEMVPCNCIECNGNVTPHFFKFTVLKKFEENGRKTVICENSTYDIEIKSLIDDIQFSSRKRAINTNSDLKSFILNIIENVLQKEITLKSSYVNFWRDQTLQQPKNETEIQPYISNTLDSYCKVNGIQLSREVKEANGNVDILLSTRNDNNELLKVCIELKKAHHQDIENSIVNQLPLYMNSVDTNAAIYLVIWLKSEAHKQPNKFNSIIELEKALFDKNPRPADISIKILNCGKPISPSKAR